MATFKSIDQLKTETLYNSTLKSGLNKVSEAPTTTFILYKKYQVGTKKIPILLVDYDLKLPPQVKDQEKGTLLAPSAIGKCHLNPAGEIVLVTRGKVPWKALRTYLAGLKRTLFVPGDAAEDSDDEDAATSGSTQAHQPGTSPAHTVNPVSTTTPLKPAQSVNPAVRAQNAGTDAQSKGAAQPSTQPGAQGVASGATKPAALGIKETVEALGDDTQLKQLAAEPARLVASLGGLLKSGLELKDDRIAALTQTLGASKGKVAAEVLDSLGKSSPTNRKLFEWAMKSADVAEVNAKGRGTAAAIYADRWDKGNWADVKDLVDRGWDTTQAKEGGAGYSGFTMPLAHKASAWMPAVHKAAAIQPGQAAPDDADEDDLQENALAKLWGKDAQAVGTLLTGGTQLTKAQSGDVEALARMSKDDKHLLNEILKELDPRAMEVPELALLRTDPQGWLKRCKGIEGVLGAIKKRASDTKGEPPMLTSYKEVQESNVMGAFKDEPGTFWGFENVRMPFVQCARETKTESKIKGDESSGNDMVLRMMDMWAALGKIDFTKYPKLMTDTDSVVRQVLEDALKSGGELDGRSDEFKKAFAKEVSGFLHRLVQERTIEDKEIAEARGMAVTTLGVSKFMGAALCKHGLEWLRDNGKKLYYCLDGIDEADFINYRTVKYEQVREKGSHEKVITLVELRHIVRNWSTLHGTVRFTRRGQFIKDQDAMVAEWARKIDADKEKAGERPLRAKSKDEFPDQLKTELNSLGMDLKGLTDVQLYELARAAALLRKAAGADQPTVLVKLLEHSSSEPLFKHRVLPWKAALVSACNQLIDPANKGKVDEMRGALVKEVNKARGDFPAVLRQWAATHP